MKFNYDQINANIKALNINIHKIGTPLFNVDVYPISSKDSLGVLENCAQYYKVSIAELLFGVIKPKYKICSITMENGETKTFYIPIDKFDDVVRTVEGYSDEN